MDFLILYLILQILLMQETLISTLDDMSYGWSGSIKGWEGDYLVSSFRKVEGFMPKTVRVNIIGKVFINNQ